MNIITKQIILIPLRNELSLNSIFYFIYFFSFSIISKVFELLIMKKIALILTALCLLSGCGTLVKLVAPTSPYESYAGTKYDWQMAQKWGVPILDLPLSFLLDTVLLPYVWAKE